MDNLTSEVYGATSKIHQVYGALFVCQCETTLFRHIQTKYLLCKLNPIYTINQGKIVKCTINNDNLTTSIFKL